MSSSACQIVAPPVAAVTLPPKTETVASATVPVLHVINGEHYSGAERVQDLLAARMPELGFDVGFVCVKPDRFPDQRQAQAAPLYELPMRGRVDLRAVWNLVRIIRRNGYELVHAHTPRSVLVGRVAAARAGVPLIYHVHSPASHDSQRRLQNWLNDQVERFCLRGAAKLITVSDSLARHMRLRGFPSDRISVVPNGVPTRGAVRPLSRLPAVWTLGTVALFRPRKGMEVLLTALAQLRRQGLPVRLRAVGPFETEDYRETLQRRVTQLGLDDAVKWTGFTADVDTELAQMDLFVLPSLFGEGLPMVVLEAMAAGLPVVGTRVEGVPEAVRDGQDGVLAAPADPDALATAIAGFVRGHYDWPAMCRSARARQARRFSDESMAAGVAEVYRQVLDGRR